MHAAIAEVGVLYVSSSVHSGWSKVSKKGRISFSADNLGGHAFALVAYDAEGFWLQNSWGKSWGYEGFAHIAYDDWLKNGTDAWVARLAVSVHLPTRHSVSRTVFAGAVRARSYSYEDLRPHVISIGNDGLLDPHGNIGTTPALVQEIVENDMPRIMKSWKKKRVVLYAHGGLVGEDSALQRIADYRPSMLAAECYPLAFIWHSDAWSTIKNLLTDAANHRRPEGFLDASKDFMLDRLDDALEPLARALRGRAMWSEMKENAIGATRNSKGGARFALQELARLATSDAALEFHLIGHSAGSIFLAPLVQLLATKGKIAGGPMKGETGLGLKVTSATLWAPAITTELFKLTWMPVISQFAQLALFTLDDTTERADDCANIYHKSLLYLVSNALEETPRIPLVRPDGEPLLGMEKFILADPVISQLFSTAGKGDWIVSPNNLPKGHLSASGAKHHGDFDDDRATVLATLGRILNRKPVRSEFAFCGIASDKARSPPESGPDARFFADSLTAAGRAM